MTNHQEQYLHHGHQRGHTQEHGNPRRNVPITPGQNDLEAILVVESVFDKFLFSLFFGAVSRVPYIPTWAQVNAVSNVLTALSSS